MTDIKLHFSSKSDLWSTPDDFFQKYNEKYHFDLDVCANEENKKCGRYFSVHDDGLSKEWSGTCWMNPPYGRQIHQWMKKAYDSSLSGATIVCLVPARTDTKWWHDYAMKGEIEFIKGRLKFGGNKVVGQPTTGNKNPAPFPSAVVVFRGSK